MRAALVENHWRDNRITLIVTLGLGLMSEILSRIEAFIAYAATLDGDEKGEAQVFCDRLFQAFGHRGYKEAGATLEDRIKAEGKSTSFADLVWKPRVLIEMKKRGAKLAKHYDAPG